MSSDVEMIVPKDTHPTEVVNLSSSASPPHHSPIVIDDDESSVPPPESQDTNTLNDGNTSSASSVVRAIIEETNVSVKDKKKSKSTSAAAPASSSATGAKPKQTKSAPRSPSPSPPPPARPPLQTVRLDITLGGPEHYEVNIAQLSKETGQRSSTPVPVKRDTSDDSHSEGDDEGDGKSKDKKRKRKKKTHTSEYYDVSDPFIDDSELAQDERTFFAQTKQQGFYVSSGQVALLDVKPPPSKKPKSKKVSILPPAASVNAALSSVPLPPSLAPLSLNAPSTSNSRPPLSESSSKKTKTEDGTRDSPIALYSDVEEKGSVNTGVKRKSMDAGDGSGSVNGSMSATPSHSGSTKKKRKVEIQPFHPELDVAIGELKEAIAKENWDVKGKFPPAIKPHLAQVALKAIILGDYDDNFFNLMPRLFPYNKFTMTKLIKRTIWRDHTALLVERQNALLGELAVLAEEGFPKAQEEWEKSVIAWEKRQERTKADTEGGSNGTLPVHSVEGTPVPSDAQPTPTLPDSGLPPREDGNDTGLEHDHDGSATGGGASGKAGGKDAGKEMHPPAKKYRLTDKMKEVVWALVCLSNECCRIENEKNQLEGSNQVVSDQGVRKSLYQKIVAAFPEGWLSSGQISREVSVMKKKYEKEAAEAENE